MKKILAVLLSIMMIFGTVAFSASAASADAIPTADILSGNLPGNLVFNADDNLVFVFKFTGGTMYTGQWELTTSGLVYNEGITNTYIMVADNGNKLLSVTDKIWMPSIIPPSGQAFNGWFCSNGPDAGKTIAANAWYEIPDAAAGMVIEFTANVSPAEPEEDTMTTIMNILIKIFGTIIGIVVYTGNVEQGIALMEEMLGSILG